MVAGHSAPGTWDIFCRVVDNFGDAAVCWRLARILRHEHDVPVRLWIDHPQTLQALYPALDPDLPQQSCEGITVCRWPQAGLPAADAAVVIEAFGCGLPEEWISRMAQTAKPPLWIILEYLSAEDWVDSHHGLASPHPRLPLPRYFFFPGFTSAAGGLLRESGLLSRRDRFGMAERQAFWNGLGFAVPLAPAVSLFAYADAPVSSLLSAMAADARPLVLAVPEGALLSAVRAWLGAAAAVGQGPWRRGALEVRALPFLPQAQYDELLWACDLNFVRGEDSFVRAQWAGRPLVWQPYRQEDDAHQSKMAAFLERYCADLAAPAAAALQAFWRDWNAAAADPAPSWQGLRDVEDELARHARLWSAKLAASGELAAQLVEFSRRKVK
jgi:uncharacterized repeat protein (TIGR03837 family)